MLLSFFRFNPPISVNKGRKPNETRYQDLPEKVAKAATTSNRKRGTSVKNTIIEETDESEPIRVI